MTMAGEPQPLANNFRIVNEDGTPTEYFIRWAQERQIDIQNGISADQAQELINEWAAQREIIAGAGLDGGGDLSQDRTLSLEPSGVTPGSYTSTDLTVDEYGRITAAASGSGGSPGVRAAARGAEIVWVNNTNTINVPLPLGTLSGDLAVVAAGHGWNVNLPAGWTNLNNMTGTNTNGAAFFKFLTPTDISNGFVTVTFGGVYYGVAGMVTYDPATVSGVGNVDAGRSASSTGTRSLSVSGVADTDSIVVFGYGRGNGVVGFVPTTANDAVNNTNASGVMGYFEPTTSGVIGETISYGSDPSGNYGVAVVVVGIPASGTIVNPYEPPALSTFSIDVGVAKTVSDTPTGGIMIVATTNASGLQARLKSATAPFTFVAGLRGNTQANFNGIGIVVRDTAGKYIFLADLAETSLEMSNWSNATTFASSPFSATWTSTPLYFRVVVDASNDVQWSVSQTRNGPWYDLSTPNAYLGTVDAVGFAVNRNNVSFAPVAWFFDYEQS